MKSSRSRGPRGLVFAAALGTSTVLTAVACTYDFHAFDPFDPGGGNDATLDQQTGKDTGPGPEDAGPDVRDANLPTCTAPPPARCLSEAGACGISCTDGKDRCRSACPILNPTECQKNCDNAEQSCKVGCTSTCATCTRDAGCEQGDQRRCDNAVNGRDS